MTTWYKAQWLVGGGIKAVEVEKNTASSVWVNGRRSSIAGSYETYHPTFEEAKTELIKKAEEDVRMAHVRLDRAKGYLGNAKGLKP